MTSIYELPGWNNPYGRGWKGNTEWRKPGLQTQQFALDTCGMPRVNTFCGNLLQSWVLSLSSFSATRISSLLRSEVYFSASVKRLTGVSLWLPWPIKYGKETPCKFWTSRWLAVPVPLFLLWAITNWIQDTLLDKEAMLRSLEGPDMWVLKPYRTSSRVEPEGNSSPSCNLIASVRDAKCRQSHSPSQPTGLGERLNCCFNPLFGGSLLPAINNWLTP